MKPTHFPRSRCCAVVAAAACNAKQARQPRRNAPARVEAGRRRPRTATGPTVVSATPAGGFLMGNPNAKVKLVEYRLADLPALRASSTRRACQAADRQICEDGQVSWEFRNYVRDPFDIAASLIARCNGAEQLLPA